MSAPLILAIIAITVPLNQGQEEGEVGAVSEAPRTHSRDSTNADSTPGEYGASL